MIAALLGPSPIRKRRGSDNLAKMLAHDRRRPEPRLCGDPLHCQLRRFEQALRTADPRARDPAGWSGADLRTEVPAQRSGAHGRTPGDDGKREIFAEILFNPGEELAD